MLLKKFGEIDRHEDQSLELQFPFRYQVPGQAPSSLECNPAEYGMFEVGYFLEAHLITNSAKEKKISANARIDVIGKSNAPEMHNQEFTNTFKLKGLFQMIRGNNYSVRTRLPINKVSAGITLPIEMEINNINCSEPVSAIRVSLTRSVWVPKHHVRKKFKAMNEEVMFTTTGSMPANDVKQTTLNLTIPLTTTEKHGTDDRPTGKDLRARLQTVCRPLKLAPSY